VAVGDRRCREWHWRELDAPPYLAGITVDAVQPAIVEADDVQSVVRDRGRGAASPRVEIEIERPAYRAQARQFPMTQVVDVSVGERDGDA
jgi:hypothetical protein